MESSSIPRAGKNESAKEVARTERPVRHRPSAELVLQFSAILDKIADQLLEVQAEVTQASNVTPRAPETKRPVEEPRERAKPSPEKASSNPEVPVPVESPKREAETENADRESDVEEQTGDESETSESAVADEPATDAESAEPTAAPVLAQARAAVAETTDSKLDLPVETEETAVPEAVSGRMLEAKGEESAPEGDKSATQTQTAELPDDTAQSAPKLEAAVEKAVKSAKAQEHAAKSQDAAPARSEESQIFEEAIQRKLEGSSEPQAAKISAEHQRSVVKESVETRSLFTPTEKLFSERTASIAEKLNQAARLVGSQERENGMPSGLRQAMEAAGPKASGIVKAGASALQGSNAELQSLLKQGGNNQKEQAESSKALPRALQLRTLEKVESALSEIARSKDGKSISVRLDPPSLGSVKVDLSLRDGSLHARIVAESPQVNMLLRDKAHELQNLLRRVGLDMERVSVSVGNPDHGAMGGQSGSSTFDFQGQGRFDDVFRGSELADTGAPRVNERVEIADDHWVA